jgi:hypothetical protein
VRRAPLPALLLALVAGALPACAYSTRRLAVLEGARTVAVLPFTSPGYRRDLDLLLTQAVVREIRARTSLAIGAPSSADLLLTGVMDAETPVLLQGVDRAVIQQRLKGTTDVTLTDRRNGRVVKRFSVYATTDFGPGRSGESLEGSATDEWVRRMAVRVVESLEEGP